MESTVDESSEPVFSLRRTRRKRATRNEAEARVSDAVNSQEVEAEVRSPSEVEAGESSSSFAGPSGVSFSTGPSMNSTPQWALELITEMKELGDRLAKLEEYIRTHFFTT